MVFGNCISKQRNSQVTLQLQENLQVTKSVIAPMANAVFWVKPNAQFIYVNDAGCSLVGYSRKELLSMTMYDINPDFSPEVWSNHWKTIKKQGSLYFEFLHWTREGLSFPVAITLIYIECDRREYGCILICNISKCKQTSSALQRTNQVLESRVQELLAELSHANEQLSCEKALRQQMEVELERTFREITKHKQAEKEIRFALEQEKQLAEHRGQFLSMVSHEFRTPLNIISFSTSSLKRYYHHLSEEKKLRYLQRLETAVEQLSQLMDEVLMLGRAEVGKLKFEPEPLNLIQFCHEILAQLNLSQSHHHPVTFVSEGDGRTVCVDKKLLQPILTNLLSNAIKYSPVDSTVDVVLSCQDKKVIFQVKDRGIGIPKAEQQRLFEPFYRAENVGDIPGNGLGLALVKKLVDLHNGQITVASEVGVGTTFTVTLPITKQPIR